MPTRRRGDARGNPRRLHRATGLRHPTFGPCGLGHPSHERRRLPGSGHRRVGSSAGDRRPRAGPGVPPGEERRRVREGHDRQQRAVPTASAAYSNRPPAIAPSRFAPNASVEDATSRNRFAKIRFPRKTGVKPRIVAAANRGMGARSSSARGGTTKATAIDANRSAKSRPTRRRGGGPDLDRDEHRGEDAPEDEGVHDSRRPEEQREPDDVRGLEEEEGGAHARQVEVRAHLGERGPTGEPDGRD